MGMDVYGKNPSSKDGEYFRACVWSWRPIHVIIGMTGVVDEKTLNSMACNDGAGLENQARCNQLADAIENVMKNDNLKAAGFILVKNGKEDDIEICFPPEGDFLVTGKGRFVNDADLATMTEEEKQALKSPYSTSYSHLKEFIVFLRACGGFEVN
jgi:hypothetical protein